MRVRRFLVEGGSLERLNRVLVCVFDRRVTLVLRSLNRGDFLFFCNLDAVRHAIICSARAWDVRVVRPYGLLCALLPGKRSVDAIIGVIVLSRSVPFPLAVNVPRRQFAVEDSGRGAGLVDRFFITQYGVGECEATVRDQPRNVNARAGRWLGGPLVYFQASLSFRVA